MAIRKQHRSSNGQYSSLSKKAEVALGVALILAVLLYHLKEANAESGANIEATEAKYMELLIKVDALESNTVEISRNLTAEEEARVKAIAQAEELKRKNVEAMNSLTAAEREIISRESGFRVTADNPNSTAFGLFQMLIGNRKLYANKYGFHPDTTVPYQQVLMGRGYISDRYGTAEKALDFHKNAGWY